MILFVRAPSFLIQDNVFMTVFQDTCGSIEWHVQCRNVAEYLVIYRINHAELSIVFATADHVPFLLGHASQLPTLKVVVVMDDMDEGENRALSAFAKDKSIKLMNMAECKLFTVLYL